MQTLLLAGSYGLFAGFGYLLGQVAGPQIGGHTTISLGTVGAVAGVVVPGALAVIVTYYKLKIEVVKLNDSIKNLYCIKNKDCIRETEDDQ